MMMKKFLLSLLLPAIAASAAELELASGKTAAVPIEQGKIEFSCSDTALTVKVESLSDQLAYLKKQYAKRRWNVFEGEAVDLTFSPYGGWPGYRFRINPSGEFFQSFLGNPKWRSFPIRGQADFTDTGWICTFTIPFAALETEECDTAMKPMKRTFWINPLWKIALSRHTLDRTGKRQIFVPGGGEAGNLNQGIALRLPETLLAPYRQMAFKHLDAGTVAANGGTGKFSGILFQQRGTAPITGKLVLILHQEDGKEQILAQTDFTTVPGQDQPFALPFQLEEQGGRFVLRLEFHDAKGNPVRISRNFPVENPWAE